MIKVENIQTCNHARAIYSARNPLNSWDRSDSDLENNIVGEKDLELARKLYKAGTEHRKFARQIFVSMDIVAPLYWWKEFDTYKVSTVANSCSTMHTIHKKEFTIDDFSHDKLEKFTIEDYTFGKDYCFYDPEIWMFNLIEELNFLRDAFLQTKNKKYWYAMVQLLPMSYNYRRTVTFNYENVFSMINQRENHKLDEWNEFIRKLKKLPYVTEIMGE